jgi:hypothetical protein
VWEILISGSDGDPIEALGEALVNDLGAVIDADRRCGDVGDEIRRSGVLQ